MDESRHPNRFPREERLRGRIAIDSLFEQGQSGFQYPFRYVWRLQNDASGGQAPVSVLIAAPKRNHKRANLRNTLKRRTREAYRLNKSPLVDCMHSHGGTMSLALVYSVKQVEEYKTIEDAVKKIISRLASGH